MTKRSIASLAIKLMAVYVLILSAPSILSLGAVLGPLGADSSLWVLFSAIVSLIIFLGAFIWLIRRADWFAQKIVPDDESTEAIDKLTLSEVQAIAFSCIGLLVLSQTLPALGQQISYIGALKYAADPGVKVPIFASSLSKILSTVLQLAIGAYLFLSPRGLVELWSRLQKTRPMKAGDASKREG